MSRRLRLHPFRGARPPQKIDKGPEPFTTTFPSLAPTPAAAPGRPPHTHATVVTFLNIGTKKDGGGAGAAKKKRGKRGKTHRKRGAGGVEVGRPFRLSAGGGARLSKALFRALSNLLPLMRGARGVGGPRRGARPAGRAGPGRGPSRTGTRPGQPRGPGSPVKDFSKRSERGRGAPAATGERRGGTIAGSPFYLPRNSPVA